MNILVTGGAGYIGSHTLIELIADGPWWWWIIFPIQILSKCGTEDLYAISLINANCMAEVGRYDASCILPIEQGILHTEVGIVRYVLKANMQSRPKLLET